MSEPQTPQGASFAQTPQVIGTVTVILMQGGGIGFDTDLDPRDAAAVLWAGLNGLHQNTIQELNQQRRLIAAAPLGHVN